MYNIRDTLVQCIGCRAWGASQERSGKYFREGIEPLFDLQKANLLKRFTAFLLDGILLGILVVGVGCLLSIVFGYDAKYDALTDLYTRYEDAYDVSLSITQDDYEAMLPEERARYEEAYNALNQDGETQLALAQVMQLSILILTFAFLISYMVLEYMVPLLFKNGQTLGKKVFGLAVIRCDGVRITPILLLVRTLLGKFTVETMVPVLIAFLLVFGGIGFTGTLVLVGMLILQVALILGTKNHTPLHEVLSHTVTVDYASQMIFDTPEDMVHYKEEYAAKKALRDSY